MQTSITKNPPKFTRTSALLHYNTTTQHAIDQFTSNNVSGQKKFSNYFQANVYDKIKHLLMETLSIVDITSFLSYKKLSCCFFLKYRRI